MMECYRLRHSHLLALAVLAAVAHGPGDALERDWDQCSTSAGMD
jgi:hypothetical protein